jgi:hypothetical protein
VKSFVLSQYLLLKSFCIFCSFSFLIGIKLKSNTKRINFF